MKKINKKLKFKKIFSIVLAFFMVGGVVIPASIYLSRNIVESDEDFSQLPEDPETLDTAQSYYDYFGKPLNTYFWLVGRANGTSSSNMIVSDSRGQGCGNGNTPVWLWMSHSAYNTENNGFRFIDTNSSGNIQILDRYNCALYISAGAIRWEVRSNSGTILWIQKQNSRNHEAIFRSSTTIYGYIRANDSNNASTVNATTGTGSSQANMWIRWATGGTNAGNSNLPTAPISPTVTNASIGDTTFSTLLLNYTWGVTPIWSERYWGHWRIGSGDSGYFTFDIPVNQPPGNYSVRLSFNASSSAARSATYVSSVATSTSTGNPPYSTFVEVKGNFINAWVDSLNLSSTDGNSLIGRFNYYSGSVAGARPSSEIRVHSSWNNQNYETVSDGGNQRSFTTPFPPVGTTPVYTFYYSGVGIETYSPKFTLGFSNSVITQPTINNVTFRKANVNYSWTRNSGAPIIYEKINTGAYTTLTPTAGVNNKPLTTLTPGSSTVYRLNTTNLNDTDSRVSTINTSNIVFNNQPTIVNNQIRFGVTWTPGSSSYTNGSLRYNIYPADGNPQGNWLTFPNGNVPVAGVLTTINLPINSLSNGSHRIAIAYEQDTTDFIVSNPFSILNPTFTQPTLSGVTFTKATINYNYTLNDGSTTIFEKIDNGPYSSFTANNGANTKSFAGLQAGVNLKYRVNTIANDLNAVGVSLTTSNLVFHNTPTVINKNRISTSITWTANSSLYRTSDLRYSLYSGATPTVWQTIPGIVNSGAQTTIEIPTPTTSGTYRIAIAYSQDTADFIASNTFVFNL